MSLQHIWDVPRAPAFLILVEDLRGIGTLAPQHPPNAKSFDGMGENGRNMDPLWRFSKHPLERAESTSVSAPESRSAISYGISMGYVSRSFDKPPRSSTAG